MRKQLASAHATVRSPRTLVGSRPVKSLLDRAYNEIKLPSLPAAIGRARVLSEAAISDELRSAELPFIRLSIAW